MDLHPHRQHGDGGYGDQMPKTEYCFVQQMCRQSLQSFLFALGDVGALILGKTKNEYPTIALVGRNQRPEPAALALPYPGHPFFDQPAA